MMKLMPALYAAMHSDFKLKQPLTLPEVTPEQAAFVDLLIDAIMKKHGLSREGAQAFLGLLVANKAMRILGKIKDRK